MKVSRIASLVVLTFAFLVIGGFHGLRAQGIPLLIPMGEQDEDDADFATKFYRDRLYGLDYHEIAIPLTSRPRSLVFLNNPDSNLRIALLKESSDGAAEFLLFTRSQEEQPPLHAQVRWADGIFGDSDQDAQEVGEAVKPILVDLFEKQASEHRTPHPDGDAHSRFAQVYLFSWETPTVTDSDDSNSVITIAITKQKLWLREGRAENFRPLASIQRGEWLQRIREVSEKPQSVNPKLRDEALSRVITSIEPILPVLYSQFQEEDGVPVFHRHTWFERANGKWESVEEERGALSFKDGRVQPDSQLNTRLLYRQGEKDSQGEDGYHTFWFWKGGSYYKLSFRPYSDKDSRDLLGGEGDGEGLATLVEAMLMSGHELPSILDGLPKPHTFQVMVEERNNASGENCEGGWLLLPVRPNDPKEADPQKARIIQVAGSWTTEPQNFVIANISVAGQMLWYSDESPDGYFDELPAGLERIRKRDPQSACLYSLWIDHGVAVASFGSSEPRRHEVLRLKEGIRWELRIPPHRSIWNFLDRFGHSSTEPDWRECWQEWTDTDKVAEAGDRWWIHESPQKLPVLLRVPKAAEVPSGRPALRGGVKMTATPAEDSSGGSSEIIEYLAKLHWGRQEFGKGEHFVPVRHLSVTSSGEDHRALWDLFVGTGPASIAGTGDRQAIPRAITGLAHAPPDKAIAALLWEDASKGGATKFIWWYLIEEAIEPESRQGELPESDERKPPRLIYRVVLDAIDSEALARREANDGQSENVQAGGSRRLELHLLEAKDDHWELADVIMQPKSTGVSSERRRRSPDGQPHLEQFFQFAKWWSPRFWELQHAAGRAYPDSSTENVDRFTARLIQTTDHDWAQGPEEEADEEADNTVQRVPTRAFEAWVTAPPRPDGSIWSAWLRLLPAEAIALWEDTPLPTPDHKLPLLPSRIDSLRASLRVRSNTEEWDSIATWNEWNGNPRIARFTINNRYQQIGFLALEASDHDETLHNTRHPIWVSYPTKPEPTEMINKLISYSLDPPDQNSHRQAWEFVEGNRFVLNRANPLNPPSTARVLFWQEEGKKWHEIGELGGLPAGPDIYPGTFLPVQTPDHDGEEPLPSGAADPLPDLLDQMSGLLEDSALKLDHWSLHQMPPSSNGGGGNLTNASQITEELFEEQRRSAASRNYFIRARKRQENKEDDEDWLIWLPDKPVLRFSSRNFELSPTSWVEGLSKGFMPERESDLAFSSMDNLWSAFVALLRSNSELFAPRESEQISGGLPEPSFAHYSLNVDVNDGNTGSRDLAHLFRFSGTDGYYNLHTWSRGEGTLSQAYEQKVRHLAQQDHFAPACLLGHELFRSGDATANTANFYFYDWTSSDEQEATEDSYVWVMPRWSRATTRSRNTLAGDDSSSNADNFVAVVLPSDGKLRGFLLPGEVLADNANGSKDDLPTMKAIIREAQKGGQFTLVRVEGHSTSTHFFALRQHPDELGEVDIAYWSPATEDWFDFLDLGTIPGDILANEAPPKVRSGSRFSSHFAEAGVKVPKDLLSIDFERTLGALGDLVLSLSDEPKDFAIKHFTQFGFAASDHVSTYLFRSDFPLGEDPNGPYEVYRTYPWARLQEFIGAWWQDQRAELGVKWKPTNSDELLGRFFGANLEHLERNNIPPALWSRLIAIRQDDDF
ncbi:MAG: hypothetical protein ACFB21_04820 [Opitutales bacterium]